MGKESGYPTIPKALFVVACSSGGGYCIKATGIGCSQATWNFSCSNLQQDNVTIVGDISVEGD